MRESLRGATILANQDRLKSVTQEKHRLKPELRVCGKARCVTPVRGSRAKHLSKSTPRVAYVFCLQLYCFAQHKIKFSSFLLGELLS
jgi:hypothetical protein